VRIQIGLIYKNPKYPKPRDMILSRGPAGHLCIVLANPKSNFTHEKISVYTCVSAMFPIASAASCRTIQFNEVFFKASESTRIESLFLIWPST